MKIFATYDYYDFPEQVLSDVGYKSISLITRIMNKDTSDHAPVWIEISDNRVD
ncbi:MAG TPA: hypothetical protein VFF27_17290 [Bacteroidia bacterium]|jgi:hypothetical protein|nr:hypothetical protein [Bacteroidia bacterium]